MSSSINNNLMAANVASNLNSHYGKLATSVQRLSSGLRINSSADDAAGLAIRELMRADVAALHQGVRNANDAISMIQVADGALGVIDEKLIRMKELAEQAATGTYDSTQRLMIHSEFVAMGEEIDRIARATNFNGINLLDGSLSGAHDGSGLNSIGKMKIHFGVANDSAEDYYYVEIGDCTTSGLGLRKSGTSITTRAVPINTDIVTAMVPSIAPKQTNITLNDQPLEWQDQNPVTRPPIPEIIMPDTLVSIDDLGLGQGEWRQTMAINQNPTQWLPGPTIPEGNFGFIIPKGTKNIVINISGVTGKRPHTFTGGDNDVALFTMSGVHLAGTPDGDHIYKKGISRPQYPSEAYGPDLGIEGWFRYLGANGTNPRLPFDYADYDASFLNSGPAAYDPTGANLHYTTYNGMSIGYSGDPDRHENPPNDGGNDMNGPDYEVLTIDEATEDLIFLLPGEAAGLIKAYWTPVANPPGPDPDPGPNPPNPSTPQGDIISIKTQEEAQQALERIDDAIITKDKVRAHLGALQNRLENTVTNLTIQGENLQTAESRISDIDVATEMTALVRNQVLTQSAVAMLGQANSYPHMLSGLITS